MKAQLARSLRNLFAATMARRFPAFSPVSERWDVLSLKVSSSIYFFVHLSIDENKDSFTLEVACNRVNEFPWTELPGQLRDIPVSATKDLWRFRVSKFWGEIKDFRWKIGEKRIIDQDEIQHQIEDAVDKLSHYAVPHFSKVARSHGHGFPSGE